MKYYDEKKFNKLFGELVLKNLNNPSESVWKLLCHVRSLQKKSLGNNNQAATNVLVEVLHSTINLLDDFSVEHIEKYNNLINTSEGATSTQWKILGALMSTVLATLYLALIITFPTFLGAIITATMAPLIVFMVYDGFARHSGLAEKMNNVVIESESRNQAGFFQHKTEKTPTESTLPEGTISP